ncbi:hypothetical protein BY458DRAFT_490825 [Sporodiniella umbellata]|nr:hypothetical protein BY458DRAFT_490825 [Sporodiniella umbellata]
MAGLDLTKGVIEECQKTLEEPAFHSNADLETVDPNMGKNALTIDFPFSAIKFCSCGRFSKSEHLHEDEGNLTQKILNRMKERLFPLKAKPVLSLRITRATRAIPATRQLSMYVGLIFDIAFTKLFQTKIAYELSFFFSVNRKPLWIKGMKEDSTLIDIIGTFFPLNIKTMVFLFFNLSCIDYIYEENNYTTRAYLERDLSSLSSVENEKEPILAEINQTSSTLNELSNFNTPAKKKPEMQCHFIAVEY